MRQPIAGLGGRDDEDEAYRVAKAAFLAQMAALKECVVMTVEHPEWCVQQVCETTTAFPLGWAEDNA